MKYEPFDLERALAGEPVALQPLYATCKGKYSLSNHPTQPNHFMAASFDDFELHTGDLNWLKTYAIGMWPKEPLTLPPEVWSVLHPRIVCVMYDGHNEWHAYDSAERTTETYMGRLSGSVNMGVFPECEEGTVILRPGHEYE